MSAVARRYAKAAVDVAFDQGKGAIDALLEGLVSFRDAYRESATLRELMNNPALATERDAALAGLAKKLEMPELALSLVRLLVVNERLDLVDEVTDEIDQLSDERANRLHAKVVSAIPISDALTKRIEKALEKQLKSTVDVTVEVDPSILAGLVVKVGDRTIDSSIRRQLELVRHELLQR
jgi:F-type H+-transporting ATPase subunit delta